MHRQQFRGDGSDSLARHAGSTIPDFVNAWKRNYSVRVDHAASKNWNLGKNRKAQDFVAPVYPESRRAPLPAVFVLGSRSELAGAVEEYNKHLEIYSAGIAVPTSARVRITRRIESRLIIPIICALLVGT